MWKKGKESKSESALLSEHFPWNKSIYFSNFWVFWFFHVFHVFWCSGKVPGGPKPFEIMFFLVPKVWEAFQNDPRSIWETSFFYENSSKINPKNWPSSFSHPTKINPNSDLKVDSESFVDFLWLFLISSNSNDRILRKSQNKIEKAPFGDDKD